MGDQEALIELGPHDLSQLEVAPGSGQEGAPRAVAVYVDAEIGEREQIGEPGTDLESDETSRPLCGGNIGRPGPAAHTTGRLDDHVAQPGSAVLVGPEVGAAEQPGIELAGAEVGLRNEGLIMPAGLNQGEMLQSGRGVLLAVHQPGKLQLFLGEPRQGSARAEFSVNGKQNSAARRLTNALRNTVKNLLRSLERCS